jgi:hypothetical protein
VEQDVALHETCKKALAVFPEHHDVLINAFKKVMTVFGWELDVRIITHKGTHDWQKGDEILSSRSVALDVQHGSFERVLLFVSAQSADLPVGMMCWLESLKTFIPVTDVVRQAVCGSKNHYMVLIGGSNGIDIINKLYDRVTEKLTHVQNRYGSQKG